MMAVPEKEQLSTEIRSNSEKSMSPESNHKNSVAKKMLEHLEVLISSLLENKIETTFESKLTR